jgi:hypothetical protein
MRLTVGPLPPAVYWRRRAVVLAAVLVPVVVLLYSCGGGKPSTVSNTSGSPTATGDSVPGPTVSVLVPQSGPAATNGSPEPPPTSAAATAAAAAPPADDVCTDAEISVIPAPSRQSAPQGVTVDIKLEIKNTSDRTCKRDLGADLQEVYVKLGAEKVWSSDTCGNAKGSNLQVLSPGLAYEFRVAWNGRDATRCANNVATGPYPAPGDYQVIGRLGTKLSDPVQFTVTA